MSSLENILDSKYNKLFYEIVKYLSRQYNFYINIEITDNYMNLIHNSSLGRMIFTLNKDKFETYNITSGKYFMDISNFKILYENIKNNKVLFKLKEKIFYIEILDKNNNPVFSCYTAQKDAF